MPATAPCVEDSHDPPDVTEGVDASMLAIEIVRAAGRTEDPNCQANARDDGDNPRAERTCVAGSEGLTGVTQTGNCIAGRQ